jgi:hypothetical protein
MNTTDEHLAPQLMDTSLKEEEEEKIEQVVAVRWDEVMTDEDTVIFAGQTHCPKLKDQSSVFGRFDVTISMV